MIVFFIRILTNAILFFIVHQNIRSLRQNFDLLVCNLETLAYLPYLIFVTEIWIFACESDEFYIPGYIFFPFTNESYSAGGVGVFVRESFEFVASCHSWSSADVLKISVKVCDEILNFVCIYRLHAQNSRVFLDEFSNFLSNEKEGNLVILGDLNIDILESNPTSDSYLSLTKFNQLQSCENVL